MDYRGYGEVINLFTIVLLYNILEETTFVNRVSWNLVPGSADFNIFSLPGRRKENGEIGRGRRGSWCADVPTNGFPARYRKMRAGGPCSQANGAGQGGS